MNDLGVFKHIMDIYDWGWCNMFAPIGAPYEEKVTAVNTYFVDFPPAPLSFHREFFIPILFFIHARSLFIL